MKTTSKSPSSSSGIGSPLVRTLLIIGFAVAGIAVSLTAFFVLRQQERAQTEMAFQLRAEEHGLLLENNLRRRIDTARVLNAFYAGSDEVKRREFHDFVERLIANLDVIETLAWVRRIEGQDRRAFEQAIRAEAKKLDFRITQRDVRGRIIRAEDRDVYFPLCFVEPREVAQELLGFDLATHDRCRALFERARLSRRNVVEAMPSLVHDGKSSAVICAVMAVYPEEEPFENESQEGDESVRPSVPKPISEPLGYAVASVRVGAFLKDVVRFLEPRKLDIWLYELLPEGERRLLGFEPASTAASNEGGEPSVGQVAEPELAAAVKRHEFALGGRKFAIICTVADVSTFGGPNWLPWFTLLCGLVITGLVIGYVALLTERMSRSEMLVSDQALELQMMSQSSLNSVIVIDRQGGIHHWNPAAARTFGYAAEEIVGRMSLESLLTTREYARVKSEIMSFQGRNGELLVGQTLELTAVRKDREEFSAEMSVSPFVLQKEWRAVVVLRDISSRKRFEQKLKDGHRVMRQLIEVLERDRKLMAYEIHDGLAQQISAAIMKLQAYQGMCESNAEVAQGYLAQSAEALCEALAEARRLISGLRPPILDEMGVVAAVEYLVAEWQLNSRVEIEFVRQESLGRFAPAMETCVFRIVQESLANAVRHSGSDRVRVELGEQDGYVRIDVRDWGRGFDPQKVTKGRFGLEGIRERARLFGGSVVLETAPGEGAHFCVELPMVEAADLV